MMLRLLLLAILVVGASPVFGVPFTIANTGFVDDGGGMVLGDPGTDSDDYWSLVSCPAGSACSGGGAAQITDDSTYPFPIWFANTGTSQWISPRSVYAEYIGSNPGMSDPATACQTGNLVDCYVYRVQFDLTGYIPGSASLSFRAAADDRVAGVLLNSTLTGYSYSGLGAFSSVFDVTSGFQTGINTLDFYVRNDPAAAYSPSGLRVEFTATDAELGPEVPEPASIGLMGLGLIGLGALRVRRRKSA